MANRPTFIELLEEDIAQVRRMAENWEELEKAGGRLESPDGTLIATAGEMIARFREREKESLELIAKVRGDHD